MNNLIDQLKNLGLIQEFDLMDSGKKTFWFRPYGEKCLQSATQIASLHYNPAIKMYAVHEKH